MPKLTSPLSRNSTGESVAELHSELLSLGFAIASTELTAKRFGDDTEKAVRAFQGRHGLLQAGDALRCDERFLESQCLQVLQRFQVDQAGITKA